jgi:uncharacterized protein
MRKDGADSAPAPRGPAKNERPSDQKFMKTEKPSSQGAFGAALAEALKKR